MIGFGGDTSQGWYLTFLSSFLCILGCFVIFVEDLYKLLLPARITRRYPINLKENYKILNGALALSSGCLLFTSLFRLLPEALQYFHKSNKARDSGHGTSTARFINASLVGSYTIGILLCLALTALLHAVTSESVVHCAHSGDHNDIDDDDDDDDYHGDHMPVSEVQNYGCDDTSPQRFPQEVVKTVSHEVNIDEEAPLLHSLPSKTNSKSLLHLFTSQNCDTCNVGECKGYSSAETCLYKNYNEPNTLHYCEIPALPQNGDVELGHNHADHHVPHHPHHPHHADLESFHISNHEDDHSTHKLDHHHHVNSPYSRLFLIGVQTTLAIALHKFPEGFITYTTSETNKQLGVLIFLSLAVHNFTEGFLMCLPLYYLFSSTSKVFAKLQAFTISALLGGLSQPFGAFIGYLFLQFSDTNFGDPVNQHKLNYIFGATIAITSGFLTVVGLTMYGSAVSFNGGSLNFVLLWSLFGMVLIGLSSILTA